MKTRSVIISFIILIFILLVDLYAFRGLKLLAGNSYLDYRIVTFSAFWVIPVLFFMSVIIVLVKVTKSGDRNSMKYFFRLFGAFMLIYFPKLVFIEFLLLDEIYSLTIFIADFPLSVDNNYLLFIGLIAAVIISISVLYGMLFGRFNFKVKLQEIRFQDLPESFIGLRVVHISDIHIGSFEGYEKQFASAVDLINAQKPDLILFTGDFINNSATELDSFIPVLSKLKAKYGKYSILGNHDYGHYTDWPTKEAKENNLSRLKDAQKEAGFRLLLNENVRIYEGSDSIVISGVENWGLPPFPAYGKLDKALMDVSADDFTILLSHDPTHFSEKVLNDTSVHLTLSGHTHAMQFGFEIGKIKWSPVKWKYKHWDGIYRFDNQVLHVNRGLGFVGFPGRIGMKPEISVIELTR